MNAALGDALPWVAVMVLGLISGIGEIFSRYRTSQPIRALLSPPGLAYLVINALAAALALLLAQQFGWTFGAGTSTSADLASPSKVLWAQVIGGGLGGMMVLRSAYFSMASPGNPDKPIPVGLGIAIQAILDVVNDAIQTIVNPFSPDEVRKLLEGLDYDRAYPMLIAMAPLYARGLSKQRRDAFQEQLKQLQGVGSLPSSVKLQSLGMGIAETLGIEALRSAVADAKQAPAATSSVVPDDHGAMPANLPASGSTGAAWIPRC